MEPNLIVTSAPIDMQLAELLGEKPGDFIILCADGKPVPFFGTPYDSPIARRAQEAFVASINDKSKKSSWPEFFTNWCGYFARDYKLPVETTWKTFHPEFSWEIHRVAHGYSEHLHAAVGLFDKLGDRVQSWRIGYDNTGANVEIVDARSCIFHETGPRMAHTIAVAVKRLLTA